MALALVLEREARDLAFAGPKLCLVTDLAAGDLRSCTNIKPVFSATVQHQLQLPSPDWRLAKGGPDGAVAFGVGP